jgi:hypothetical protein
MFFGASVRIYSGGDSNVTSGTAAELLQNDTAMISVANRVITVGYITMSLPCGEQKRQNAWPEVMGNHRGEAQRVRFVVGLFIRDLMLPAACFTRRTHTVETESDSLLSQTKG